MLCLSKTQLFVDKHLIVIKTYLLAEIMQVMQLDKKRDMHNSYS